MIDALPGVFIKDGRVMVKPIIAVDGALIDVTSSLVAALAHELWKHGGEDSVLNWLEAENFLHEMGNAACSCSAARSRGFMKLRGCPDAI